MEPGETKEETAIRETKEETNLDILESWLTYVECKNGRNHLFKTEKFTGDVEIDWESVDYKWFFLEDLESGEYDIVPGLVDDIKKLNWFNWRRS